MVKPKRPSVDPDTEKRLMRVVREVCDEVGNMSHEQALESLLDHVESGQSDSEDTDLEEVLGELGQDVDSSQQGQADPFGGVSGGRRRGNNDSFR